MTEDAILRTRFRTLRSGAPINSVPISNRDLLNFHRSLHRSREPKVSAHFQALLITKDLEAARFAVDQKLQAEEEYVVSGFQACRYRTRR
jgi:hypothetical protein